MNAQMLEHNEVLEKLAAYIAGGLFGHELDQFESHIANCPHCAAQLQEARNMDLAITQLFDNARPIPGFEDRVLQRLRQPVHSAAASWRLVHPAVRCAVTGIAAALVLGAIGYVANNLVLNNHLPFAPQFASTFTQPRTLGTVGSVSSVSEDIDGDGDVKFPKRQLDESTRSYAVPPKVLPGISPPASDASGLVDAKSNVVATNGSTVQSRGSLQLGRQAVPANGPDAHYYRESLTELFATAAKTDAGHLAFGSSPSSSDFGRTPSSDVDGRRATELAAKGVPSVAGERLVAPYFKPADTAADQKRTWALEPRLGAAELEMSAEQTATLGKKVKLHDNFHVLGGAGDKPNPENAAAAWGYAHFEGGNRDSIATLAQKTDAPPPAETTPPNPTAGQTPPPNVQTQLQLSARKIIRNGEMEFEVETFDSAAAQVNKIVQEEGGYVSSTDSEKLPNGKVKGTLAVRVPPDRLDTLILKLRALGDLKTQKIAAQDVTKVYYDLESELKAARAMEERLLNIIKTGKGEIKDLIEAEKQLGNYREKIEKLEGEVRYYNNLVSLSTLKITLSEKDIKSAAFASQSESVSMGIETDDVEKARADAIKAIEDAKGRVVESNLKKFDAGQLAATIVCEIAPDASGPLIDRLKQLGRIARLDIDRKQTTPSGSTGAPPPTRIDKKDTRFSISIYNLANIAPRQTTVLNLAVTNVEDAYKSILDAVKARNGRVVSSALNRQKPEQTAGSISFEVPSADADATLAELRRERDVLSLTVTENPDTNNVTTAKRGFSVVITSLATVPPRETETQVIATNARVADAYRAILDVLKKADARILVSQLNQQDASNVNGQLDFEVLRTREADVRQAISAQADLISRSSARSSDAENTVDSKIRISVKLLSIDRISPRETFTLGIAAKDVPVSYRTLLSALHEQGSRVIQSQLNEQDVQNISGLLDFEVVREKRPAVEKAIKDAGFVYSRVVAKVADTQSSVDTKVRIVVNFMNLDRIAPRETVTMRVQVPNTDSATATLLKTSDSASARIVESTQSKAGPGESSSHIVIECPLAKADILRQKLKDLGAVQLLETARNIQSPDGEIARTRFDISLLSPDVSRSMGGAIRNGWEVAFRGLMYSLSLIVIGILFVAPWALAIFGAVRLFRRRKTATISAA